MGKQEDKDKMIECQKKKRIREINRNKEKEKKRSEETKRAINRRKR